PQDEDKSGVTWMSTDEVASPDLSQAHPLLGPDARSRQSNDRRNTGPRGGPRFGVAFRLLVSYVAITAFAAATSALAVYAFARYRVGFEQLVSENLAALAQASALAQRSEKLAANAPALAAVESHFERQAVRQELNDELQELSEIVDDLGRFSLDRASLSAL